MVPLMYGRSGTADGVRWPKAALGVDAVVTVPTRTLAAANGHKMNDR